MSRVGKKPISLPAKVSVKATGSQVQVEGPKGKLNFTLPEGISFKQEGNDLLITRGADDRRSRALHGTSQRLITNMVKGVSDGFVKDLEIHGTGWRASVKGDALDLSVGYSHPVLHKIPSDIKVTVTENTKIKIEGIDKQRVGQFAADVRSWKEPEPYKAKGIRYAGEQIRRKEGKKVK